MRKLNEIRVSFYNNVRDTKGKIITLEQIVNDITKGTYKESILRLRNEKVKKERSKIKSTLPAFTISGTFEINKRKADCIKNYNGLIQIDFDDVSNLDETLNLLKADIYTYIAFLSPSGNGIKLIVKVPDLKENHLNSFIDLSEYYKNTFNLDLDKSCKDVSRLFFISYDKNLFINENSKVYISNIQGYSKNTQKIFKGNISEIQDNSDDSNSLTCFKTEETTIEKKKVSQTTVPLDNIAFYNNKFNDNKIVTPEISDVTNDIQIVIQRILDRRIDITQGYNNWLKIGFVFSNIFGESGRTHFHNISSINSEYNYKDCDNQYSNCMKSKNQGVNPNTFFYLAKENGINISISKKLDTNSSINVNNTIQTKKENRYPKEDFEENGFWEEKGSYYTKGQKGSIKRVSKCTIEPLYLFKDGTNNANRLIKISNKQNGESLIEIPAKDLTSIQSFKTAIRSKGNYTFLGNGTDLDNLIDVLCQNEVDAKKVQTLGALKEFDCFAFSNGVIDSENKFRKTDEYGVIKIGNESLYIPASSSLNDDNTSFTSEKVFKYKEGNLDFNTWSNLFIKAYGNKGLIGTAFFVSALYRDLVFDYKGHYPFLFLFGERQTGKTTFTECLLYPFTPEPDKWAIALTNSTHKSLERKNSKVKNGICYNKEYNKNTLDKHIIAYYKSAFDGSGGEKAQFSNDNKTHQTPVESAFIIDGNYLPTQESALMDRMIILYYYKNYFTAETKQASIELIKSLKNGGGQIVKEVLKHRIHVQRNIRNTFDNLYFELKKNSAISERTADNLASFGAPVLSSNFLTKELQKELIEELLKIGIEQEKNLHMVDEVNRFWKSVVYHKETMNTDFLISNGLYFNEKVFGVKLNLFYKLYVRYMEENKLNDSILEEMALKKQVTQEKYKGLINKSKIIKVKGVAIRCAVFDYNILKDLDE